ncbi:MAG: protein kinase [Deltaproteobacteria bacterium]|nr:protein kinase [Deltaproteobacteria bacterium]
MKNDDTLIGGYIGSYKILEIKGDGSYGTIYRGVHPTIEKEVAIKVLSSEFSQNGKVVKRFIDEAKAVNRIKHPNIIQIFDFGKLKDGRFFYVMELVNGEELRDMIYREVMIEISEIIELTRLISKALDAVHSKNIVHRDLKPGNILINHEDNHLELKILDFGIAKLQQGDESANESTTRGVVMGTPAYMAPEQARGESDVGPQADIYSLGVIVYQMLSGRLPYVDDNGVEDLIRKIVYGTHPTLDSFVAGLPAGISDIVETCLKKEPSERYKSAGEFFSEFYAAANNPVSPLIPGTDNPVTRNDPHKDWLERTEDNLPLPMKDVADGRKVAGGHRRILLGISGVLLLVLVVLSFLIHRNIQHKNLLSGSSPEIKVSEVKLLPADLLGNLPFYNLRYIYSSGHYFPVLDTGNEMLVKSLIMYGKVSGNILYFEDKPMALTVTSKNIKTVPDKLLASISTINDPAGILCNNDDGKRILRNLKYPALIWGHSLKDYTCINKAPGYIHLKLRNSLSVELLPEVLRYPNLSGITGEVAMNEKIATAIGESKTPLSLSFESSKVTDRHLALISRNTGIRALYLRGNPITNMGAAAISGIVSLRYLSLDKTRITDAALIHLANLKNLRELYLIKTRIAGSDLKVLGKMLSLKALSLSKTSVTDIHCEHISNFRKLEMLSLGGTKISDRCIEYLSKNENISVIYLYSTKITDKSAPFLGRMNLKLLSAEYTGLGDETLAALSRVRSLRRLIVTKTSLSDRGLVPFEKISHSLFLGVRKNSLFCETIEKLKKNKNLTVKSDKCQKIK